MTIAHWNCGTDRVTLRIMDKYKSQAAASRKAHARERKLRALPGFAGYKLLTTGI